MFLKRGLLIIIFAAVICAAALIATRLPRPQPVSNTFFQLAHAQLQDPKTGCATCHTQPIVADCVTCHSQPPTVINGINFPHHNTAPGGEAPNNCQSSSCHDGGQNDARYVVSPSFNMTYCQNCHQLEHSTP